MNEVTVIDAPCGRGKTTWAINHMNANPGPFIFVTPYLNEVTRIMDECANRRFTEPMAERFPTKTHHLKHLIEHEANIVSTHSLFGKVDEETIELLRLGNYTLILDEVMSVVEILNVSRDDVTMIINEGYLDVENGNVKVTPKGHEYKGEFRSLIDRAKDSNLVYHNNTFMIWQFQPNVFRVLKEAYVLTYLFKGQTQSAYYDFNNIPARIMTINEEREVTPWSPCSDADFRAYAADHLEVYEGNLNRVGDGRTLSYYWYQNNGTRALGRKVQKATYSFFKNNTKGNADKAMWTCFKASKNDLKGKGYTKGFISCNMRATNDYAGRTNLAYLINRHLNPGLVQFMKSNDIEMNADLFAVSEMIQWIWRSRIRDMDGTKVQLFVPSKRMRNLLGKWLRGELYEDLVVS